MRGTRETKIAPPARSNVTELHPEELFDKQDAGELNRAEALELAHHLERCATCRVERAARAEFRMALEVDAEPRDLVLGVTISALLGLGGSDRGHGGARDSAGVAEPAGVEVEPEGVTATRSSVSPHDTPAGSISARPLDARSVEVLRALTPHGSISTPHGIAEVAAPRPRPRASRRARATSLIVAALLFTGAAAAWQLKLGMTQRRAEPQLTTAGAPAASQARPATFIAEHAAPGPDEAELDLQIRKVSEASLVGSTRSHAAIPPHSAPSSPSTSAARPGAAAPSPDRAPAAQLFVAANRERSAGRSRLAQQHYAELVRRFPKSPEARAARALSAQLALDTGSPDQALAEYDRYLSTADAAPVLTEEALVGRARALSRMQDRAAERGAWLELLRRFPTTPARKEAEQRLASTSNP